MKKATLAIIAIALVTGLHAQSISDTVTTGASYANQVWYSLANGEQLSAPKGNWDLAFDASGFGSTILINSITGTTLWKYPNSDTSGWASIDTSGISMWPARWNSDTSWSEGALGRYADPSNSSDLDWGIYNVITHIVTGDSLYIIKLSTGAYKKLWVQSLSGSTYTFRYANLDGSDLQNATINKTAYSGKNFGYYSLQANTALDREPLSDSWDLLFSQYTTFIPTAYTVTGILANKGVEIAKFTGLSDKATFVSYGTGTFLSPMNTIGYDWKSFSGSAYTIKDSTVYFVKTVSGDIWKVICTGFGGSANGNYMFSKEKLYTATGVGTDSKTPAMILGLYPNPSRGGDVTVLYSGAGAASLAVYDVSGKVVYKAETQANGGLSQMTIPANALRGGTYIITLVTGTTLAKQLLIVP